MIDGRLFTRDFLQQGIRETGSWQALDAAKVAAARAAAARLLNDLATRKSPNEAQTEDDLVYPLLEQQGWADREVQPNASIKARLDVPDALLFPDAASKATAVKLDPWQRFQHGTATLITDESRLYSETGSKYASHETVKHSGIDSEWVNKNGYTTNNVENFFGVFKRGFKGTYSHCEGQHLQRYLNEFDFRYTFRKITDNERRSEALKRIEGKRLTYRRLDQAGLA